jgi:hypothetical protein
MENKNKNHAGPTGKSEAKRQDQSKKPKEPTGEKTGLQRPSSQIAPPKGKSENESQRGGNHLAQSDAQQSMQPDNTITNQDSQRQVTNSGETNRPMGEKETEGN